MSTIKQAIPASSAQQNQDKWHWQTLAVRQGAIQSNEQENNDAIYLTSSFAFASAEQAKQRFAGELAGNVYSRFSNPNTTALAKRIATLEGAEFGLVTASGMSAILCLNLALLEANDEIIVANELFGTSIGLFRDLLSKFALQVKFVPLLDYAAWQRATTPKTKMLFCETPSNPLCQLVDLQRLAQIAHSVDALLVVDNCFATPALQQPLLHGADVVTHSLTKFIDGGGKCLGGAVVCNDVELQQKMHKVLRTSGFALSPMNAWMMQKSLETLNLRMLQHSDNACKIATWLQQQPQVQRVYHPSLFTGEQRQLLHKQMSAAGAIVSFELANQQQAWQVIDHCRLFSITANLGDARSSICHSATTTHNRLDAHMRQQAGISDGLVRLSVGLEAVPDLCADLQVGLASLNI